LIYSFDQKVSARASKINQVSGSFLFLAPPPYIYLHPDS
jgi:hypothetical protein